jgi:two-component system response regulator RegX3
VTLALREVDIRPLPPDTHPTILVIDGDASSRESLAADLSVEGFDVVTAVDGDQGVTLVTSARPSLILLDLSLSGRSGLSIYRQIAFLSSVPVIMITAQDDEIDAVVSLDAGAADHVTKPFRHRELTARVRAVLRRVGHQPVPTQSHPPSEPRLAGSYVAGPVSIDVDLRETTVLGVTVELSRKEFDLLALLLSEVGHVVTRSECIERLWSGRYLADSRTLDTHIKRLRKKIEVHPSDPRHIRTVRGIGYRFKP